MNTRSQSKGPFKKPPQTAQNPVKLEKTPPTVIKTSPISRKPLVNTQVAFVVSPAQFKQLKFTQNTIPESTELKTTEEISIKCENFDQHVMTETLQPSMKQEREENSAIMPNDDDEYGDIEVLDEFYDEVMNASPSDMKVEMKTYESCYQQDRSYRCKKCPLAFRNCKDLADHRLIHKKADYWCEKCGQLFRFQASFLNHDCNFSCNLCGKSISNKANLKIHMNYVHNCGNAKIFTCDLCGRFYKSKRNIDTHMKIHMTVTPFNCSICGKGFSYSGALKIHMWNHQDAVACEFCKKNFKPRSLYYHVKKCTNNWELFGGAPECEEIAVKHEANVKQHSTKSVMIVKKEN